MSTKMRSFSDSRNIETFLHDWVVYQSRLTIDANDSTVTVSRPIMCAEQVKEIKCVGGGVGEMGTPFEVVLYNDTVLTGDDDFGMWVPVFKLAQR